MTINTPNAKNNKNIAIPILNNATIIDIKPNISGSIIQQNTYTIAFLPLQFFNQFNIILKQ